MNFFLPNLQKYIMLTSRNKRSISVYRAVSFLIFISVVTFHSKVSAQKEPDLANNAEVYRSQGYAEQQKGNLQGALTYYSKAVALGLDSPTIYNDLGVIYEQLGRIDLAEQYYLNAISHDVNYLPAYTNLAYFYKAQGKREKAAEYFVARYNKAQPGDPWLEKIEQELKTLDPSYAQFFMKEEARQLSQETQKRRQEEFYENMLKAQEHYAMGEKLSGEGHYQEAVREYDAALLLTPRLPKFLEARKKALIELTKENIQKQADQAKRMVEMEDPDSARQEIQKMLTVIPK